MAQVYGALPPRPYVPAHKLDSLGGDAWWNYPKFAFSSNFRMFFHDFFPSLPNVPLISVLQLLIIELEGSCG